MVLNRASHSGCIAIIERTAGVRCTAQWVCQTRLQCRWSSFNRYRISAAQIDTKVTQLPGSETAVQPGWLQVQSWRLRLQQWSHYWMSPDYWPRSWESSTYRSLDHFRRSYAERLPSPVGKTLDVQISQVAYRTKEQPNIIRTATDTARLLMFVWTGICYYTTVKLQ